MIYTVFGVPTPKHTWNSSERQTDGRTILNHSTRTIVTHSTKDAVELLSYYSTLVLGRGRSAK